MSWKVHQTFSVTKISCCCQTYSLSTPQNKFTCDLIISYSLSISQNKFTWDLINLLQSVHPSKQIYLRFDKSLTLTVCPSLKTNLLVIWWISYTYSLSIPQNKFTCDLINLLHLQSVHPSKQIYLRFDKSLTVWTSLKTNLLVIW